LERKIQNSTGAQILVASLLNHYVDKIFCVPGESYLSVLDALYDYRNEISLINANHETGASNMAEAYGKLTGRPGIAFVTRGPGACHASIGVHISKQDSSPMILFIGQVESSLYGKESFQEIDYLSMFSKVAKWTYQISNVDEIEKITHKAFQVANTGRKGPVVISLPEDILSKKTSQKKLMIYKTKKPKLMTNKITKLKSLVARAKKPIMILGGGNWSTESRLGIEKFSLQNHLPVVTSFRRQDLIDNRCENFVGTLGTSVSPELLNSFKDADVILSVGARLSDMSTNGYNLFDSSLKKVDLIHVYPDSKEINRVFESKLSIQTDINEFVGLISNYSWFNGKKWDKWLSKLKKEYKEDFTGFNDNQNSDFRSICHNLSENYFHSGEYIITLDAGNHTGWPQRFLKYHQNCLQIGSTCGSMGYSIPASISSALVFPQKKIIAFVGDGGFLMSGLEISTAVNNNLNIIIILINNSSYGTIRMHQERHFPKRVIGTDIKNPDFVSLASSMGAEAVKVTNAKEFFIAFNKFLTFKGVTLIELITDSKDLSTRLRL
tara:strand:- start:1059 stop:2714 length:1656 start_codon:yes stop_codon:yes gene_type:complete